MNRAVIATIALVSMLVTGDGAADEIMPIDPVPDAPVVVPSEGFSVRMPAGWGLLRPTLERVRATRAGATLSLITFEFRARWRTESGRPIAALSPRALAEYVLGLESRERDPLELRVESLASATLGGCAGFRAEISRHSGNERFRRVAYGWATAGGYYMLTYDAPALHYFAQDLPAFEAVATSIVAGRPRVWKKCATDARA